MALSDNRDIDLSLNLDTQQATQSLASLSDQVQEFKKLLHVLPENSFLNAFIEQAQKGLLPLQQFRQEWSQIAHNMTQSQQTNQALLGNIDSQNKGEVLQTLKTQISTLRDLSQNSADPFGQALQSLKALNLGNSPLGVFFHNAISGFDSIRSAFKQFQSDTQNTGKGLLDFLSQSGKAQATLSSLGSQAIQAIGQQFLKGKTGLTKAIGSTLTGAASGALAGLSAGPIGAAVGGLIGTITGAASGSGGKFDAKAGLIGLPFGLIGFGIAGLIGGAKKAADAAKQLKKTQDFMQNILSQVDRNDLNSLQSALNQVLNFKSGGGQAFQAKSQAAQQLQQAIKARSDVIAQAVKDLQFQNSALAKQLQEFDSLPFQNLDLERQINLDQLTNDRDTTLQQFKDSLQVQQEVQQNFELKRQALLKQSSQDIIDTVIDEQNKIRTLRAKTAVNDAKTSGDALTVINAELQARLVAIDNDIDSFKGAEAEKTEFLKEKTSERNAIIKDANNQVSDLLQQGLDILNQGLVVGQSKAQSQQSQLKKLFGNLNPLGLIQADGNLVQSNVTVGSGAFQFILQGIQDAQSLIAQLQDPLIQNALQQALNTAISRT
jgi:hypothetical protein